MKVLIVSPAYTSTRRGGAEVVAHRTASGFKDLGWQVEILAAQSSGEATEADILVRRIRPWNLCSFETANTLPLPLRYLWAAWDATGIGSRWHVRATLKKGNYDLIVIHSLRGLGYGLVPVFTKAAACIYVAHDVQLLEPSGILLFESAEKQLHAVSRQVYRWLLRKVFRSVRTVVFPSAFLKELYGSYNLFIAAKSFVLANPMLPATRAAKSEKISIVYDGQLEPQKGIYTLFSAWSSLPTLDAELHILGEGSAVSAVQNLAALDSRVQFLGRPQGEEKSAVYDAASIIVLPSLLIENSPVIVCEALARGVPVVASDVGGVAELVAGCSLSVVVPVGSSEALAEALLQAVSRVRAGETQAPVRFPTNSEYAERLTEFSDGIQK